jgi:hypothetical protein
MRCTLLLSLALGIVGCGGHGVPTPPNDMAVGDDLASGADMELDMSISNDSGTYVTFTMFAQDFAKALCAHAVACGQLDAAQMSACLERNLLHTGWNQDVEILKGHMEINELQCLDALNKSRCDSSDSGQWETRCNAFLYKAHQVLGASCLANAECVSGFCQHGGSDAGVTEMPAGCPGVCATPKTDGEACRVDTDCATNSICDTTSHQCTKTAALNEDCSVNFCAFGLMCPTFPAAQPPTCVTPTTQTALHGACDPFQGALTPAAACAGAMYCQVKYTANATVCANDGDCGAVYGAFCDLGSGKCQDPSGGTCETKLASAAVCDPHNEGVYGFVDSQCADGTLCYQAGAQASPTCQPLGSADADCKGDNTCKIGLYCNAGKCTPWLTDGQACDVNTNAQYCPSQTLQAVCLADDGTSATICHATQSFGGACTPGVDDPLCEPSDVTGSTACIATGGTTTGTCAPKCF